MADVPGGVVKIVELVGSSPDSFSEAVRNAVKTAAQTIRNIRGVDVISSTAEVDGEGNLTLYKVHCKIAFLVEASGVGDGGGGGGEQAERDTTGGQGNGTLGGPPTRPPSDS